MNRLTSDLRVPSWVRRLDQLPLETTQAAITESREFLRAEVQKNLRKGGDRGLHVRTGTLSRSVRTYLKLNSKGADLSLGMVFYGWVNNFGATIVPKKAPRLRFNIPGVGWRSAARVVIPARPFAEDALNATTKAFPAYLQKAIRAATGGST